MLTSVEFSDMNFSICWNTSSQISQGRGSCLFVAAENIYECTCIYRNETTDIFSSLFEVCYHTHVLFPMIHFILLHSDIDGTSESVILLCPSLCCVVIFLSFGVLH